jgi:hypothetical protein
MKQFLNSFMKSNRRVTPEKIAEYEGVFKRTCDAVIAALGEKPFHIHRGLNAAVYDSTFTAFAGHLSQLKSDYDTPKGRMQLRTKFEQLTTTPAYMKLASAGTTDEDVIRRRIRKASSALFG